jgi:tetratricopeptide (TPR) repeat protein
MNLDSISAINRLRTVVKNDPKNADASALLARAHEMNNESSLAENELRKAIEANPVNNQVHVNYAGYLISKGRTDEALDIVDKALTYFDNDYELLKVKLRILASQQKNDELLAVLNRMETAEPSMAEVNTTRAQLYLSKGEVDKALEQYELAYDKSVEKYKPLENIVKVYVSNGQSDKALARLQKRFDVDPDDSIANYLVGHVLLSQNKPDEARMKFREAAKVSSEWFPPYYGMAVSYLAENNIDKAIEAYNEAVENLKVKTPAQMQLASLYERKQSYTDAMEVYKQIIEDNPANQVAANNYAALLLDYGNPGDIAAALEIAKGFEKLQQPAFQDTLAWAYAKSGDYQKAIDILMPIVERASNVAVFRYHLGYALYHSGDKPAAKSHLEIAVDSEQDFPGKIEAEALLKEI